MAQAFNQAFNQAITRAITPAISHAIWRSLRMFSEDKRSTARSSVNSLSQCPLCRPRWVALPSVLQILIACQLLVTGAVIPRVAAAETNPPTVLATIKPLHSLAYVVTEGVSTPDLLLDGVVSPHVFQMKPSHIRAIQNADLVLWAGDGVERFIPSMLEKFNPNAKSIESAGLPDAITHQSRNKHSKLDHEHAEIDYHLWLDPQNAIAVVGVLAVELSQLDPANADRYQRNAKNFTASLADTVTQVSSVLEPAKGMRYLIYHDSLQYMEKAFGLGEAVVVAPQPQVQAGGKRLRGLRNEVIDESLGCLLSEPQFRSPVVNMLAEELKLKPVMVDPLATGFTRGPTLYADWLLKTATDIASCFAISQ